MVTTPPTEAAALGRRLVEEFGEELTWADRSSKRLYVSMPPPRLPEAFGWLREHVPGLRYGTATVIDLRQGIGVLHHVNINGSPLVITLKVVANKPDPAVPSLAAIVPAARWIEREMSELMGVEFTGHPDAGRLLKAEAFRDTYPLRRDFDVAEFKDQIGEPPEF
jgi:Ni,Fe-hydrogenase III component G